MNEHEVISRLSAVPDDDGAVHVDVDTVISSVRLQRRRRRGVAGTVLATAGLIAGLVVVTNQFDRDTPSPTEAATPGAWTINSPDISNGWLSGIAAISQSDVWTVGVHGLVPDGNGLAMHWDGTQWKRFDFPKGSFVSGVTAIAPNDVWAVGTTWSVENSERFTKPLAMHWNGSSWQDVPVPPMGDNSVLYGVAAVSADDVWAIGSPGQGGPLANHPFIVHWDGKEWRAVETPAVPGANYMALRSIDALAANDVWVVGKSDAAPGELPLSLHWDGQQWSVIPVTEQGGDLFDVLALAPNDVWAAADRNRFFHWDGSRWQLVPVPEEAMGYYRTLAPDGSGGILAAGSLQPCQSESCRENNNAEPHMLVARWNGTTWTPIPPPVDASGRVDTMSTVPGTDVVWAVGDIAGKTPAVEDRVTIVASTSLSR